MRTQPLSGRPETLEPHGQLGPPSRRSVSGCSCSHRARGLFTGPGHGRGRAAVLGHVPLCRHRPVRRTPLPGLGHEVAGPWGPGRLPESWRPRAAGRCFPLSSSSAGGPAFLSAPACGFSHPSPSGPPAPVGRGSENVCDCPRVKRQFRRCGWWLAAHSSRKNSSLALCPSAGPAPRSFL